MGRQKRKVQGKGRRTRPAFSSVTARTAGLPPGSPIYLGERAPTEAALSLFVYDEAAWRVDCPATTAALLEELEPDKVNWINVNGLSGGAVERICDALGIHPLVVEDILTTEHRPHVESYDDFLFIITKMLSPRADGSIEYEQVSIIVTNSTVVTIQETPGDCFGPIRERIKSGAGRLRRMGPGYLAYGLLDVIVDNYFFVLEGLGDRLDRFEFAAIDPAASRRFMPELQELKEELLRLRRVLWPVRDSIAALTRLEGTRFSSELSPFLRDLLENCIQAVEAVETYREHAASLLEVYLSSVSNRMNEVMKVLTIISTIFIPLTFLAGVYGMNFRYMPELALPWTYPALLGLMAVIACGMLVYFKRKHWF